MIRQSQVAETARTEEKYVEPFTGYPQPDAVKAEVRLYENIIDEEKGVYNEDGSLNLNPNSLTVLDNCYVEPCLTESRETMTASSL